MNTPAESPTPVVENPKPTVTENRDMLPVREDMDFSEAIKEIIQGHNVTKREWGNDEIYLCRFEGYLVIHKTDNLFHKLIVTDGDLLGEDWVIVYPF